MLSFCKCDRNAEKAWVRGGGLDVDGMRIVFEYKTTLTWVCSTHDKLGISQARKTRAVVLILDGSEGWSCVCFGGQVWGRKQACPILIPGGKPYLC
jgi:hypothetical protein